MSKFSQFSLKKGYCLTNFPNVFSSTIHGHPIPYSAEQQSANSPPKTPETVPVQNNSAPIDSPKPDDKPCKPDFVSDLQVPSPKPSTEDPSPKQTTVSDDKPYNGGDSGYPPNTGERPIISGFAQSSSPSTFVKTNDTTNHDTHSTSSIDPPPAFSLPPSHPPKQKQQEQKEQQQLLILNIS